MMNPVLFKITQLLHFGKEVYMAGIPMDWKHDGVSSPFVHRYCTDCGCSVWSSEMKEKIRSIKPTHVHLLCINCMKIVAEKNPDLKEQILGL
jgi:hypothetical protein